MLTCRSCTNFFVQGDFSSARSRAALRLLVLLLKLQQPKSVKKGKGKEKKDDLDDLDTALAELSKGASKF